MRDPTVEYREPSELGGGHQRGKRLRDGRTGHFLLPVFAALALTLLGARSWALTINTTYPWTLTNPPPSDPSGLQLQAIMGQAVAFWEDVIEDTWTMNLIYYWDDLDDETNILALETTRSVSGGRPQTAEITFDTALNGSERNWYFDATPTDSSEFALSQKLVGDLTPSQVAIGYNGAPPDLLEVRFNGSARASAPDSAKTDFDLFSVMLHELGHALGMAPLTANTETADGDYDIPPPLVGGATTGALVAPANNIAHLAAPGTLMAPTFAPGTRRLASATDILAVASAVGWTAIDLPRQDFLNGTSWNAAAAWEGNQVPDAADDAYVRHGGAVALAAAAGVANLTVADGSELDLGGQNLSVAETTTVAASGSRLVIPAGGQLLAADLAVLTGGQVELSGGTVQLTSGATVDAASSLMGAGLLEAATWNQYGTLAITAATTIDADSRFYAGSITALAADLQLAGTALVESGATFNGIGDLVLPDGFVLSAQNGAAITVDVVNAGRFEPGLSAASVSVGGYTQQATGTLQIELGGTASGSQFDQLHATGSVLLGGNLEVSLIDSFALTDDLEFEILNVDGALIGTFVGLPANSLVGTYGDTDLFIRYNGGDGNDVVLFTPVSAVPGDLDHDGDVDFDDVDPLVLGLNQPAVYEATYGVPATLTGDVDQDGDLDFDDIPPFVALLTSDASALRGVPEPATGWLLFWAAVVLAAGRVGGRGLRVEG